MLKNQANDYIRKLEDVIRNDGSKSTLYTSGFNGIWSESHYMTFAYTLLQNWNGRPLPDGVELDRLESIIVSDINYAIKHASEIVCLTSPAVYIRECKRWYMQSSLQLDTCSIGSNTLQSE